MYLGLIVYSVYEHASVTPIFTWIAQLYKIWMHCIFNPTRLLKLMKTDHGRKEKSSDPGAQTSHLTPTPIFCINIVV